MHAISPMSNLHKIQDIFGEYLRQLELAQTDEQTDKQTEFINSFQLYWKGLKTMLGSPRYRLKCKENDALNQVNSNHTLIFTIAINCTIWIKIIIIRD